MGLMLMSVTDETDALRLALACLSPFVLDQYRAGKATLELLQAFTLTNDHAAQEHRC
jgi:hypothetical protein